MGYRHTQHGKLHLLILAAALAAGLAAVCTAHEPVMLIGFGVTALLCVGLAFCFKTLTVADDGEALLVRFGPLGLFRRRFRYDRISKVEPGRTTVLHGWGIHGFWGYGWTYNLWGFDCVKFRYGKIRINLGTDDPEGLAAFLRRRLAED